MPKRRNENAPYWQQLREAERRIIEYALEHGQTLRGTAALLGISPNYLSERTRELGITVPEVRPGPKPGTKRPAKPALRVVADDPPPGAPEDEDDVIEDEVEEGDEDEAEGGDEDEGDPWEEGDDDEDEDEDKNADTGGQVADANHDAAEGN